MTYNFNKFYEINDIKVKYIDIHLFSFGVSFNDSSHLAIICSIIFFDVAQSSHTF